MTEQKIKIKPSPADFALFCALFLLMTLAVTVSLVGVLWIFKVSVTAAHFPVAAFISAAVTVFIAHKTKKSKLISILAIAFSVIFIIFAMFICARDFDYTFDSMAYHKLAVGMIADGWNPVYEDSADFVTRTELFYDMNPDVQALWIDHYAKGSWMFSGALYKLVGNIEATKIMPLISALITFCLGFVFFETRSKNKIFSIIFGLVCSVTPVVFTQAITFYIDGILASMLTSLVLLLLLITEEKSDYAQVPDITKWICLASVVVTITNIKFTGFAYAGVFACAFYIFWIVYDIVKHRFKWKKLISVTAFFLVIVIFSVAVIGFSSYMRNQLEHGNFLYPLAGDDKVDIMTENEPDSFASRSTIGKLFLAIFGEVSNKVKEEPTPKVPFTAKEEEFTHYCSDTRISGFGVYFSGILVISIICLMYVVPLLFYKNKKKFALAVTIICVICGLLLGLSDSWWARYSPHMYFIPIAAIFLMIDSYKDVGKKLIRYLLPVGSAVIVIAIIMNTKTYIDTYTNYFSKTKAEIKEQIQLTKEELGDKQIEIYIDNYYYVGALYNLRDFGIDFTVIRDEIENGKAMPLKYLNMTYRER